MRARPLGHFVAVQAKPEETFRGCSILRGAKGKGETFLKGTVLRCGPGVGPEVSEGDEVFYEAQSAHKGQTQPFDAAIFGGTTGANAYIIPVYPSSLLSVEEIDRERVGRTRERDRLKRIAKRRNLDGLESAQLAHHELRIGILNIRRRGRSRGNHPITFGDQAVGSGVVAVVMQPTTEAKEPQ